MVEGCLFMPDIISIRLRDTMYSDMFESTLQLHENGAAAAAGIPGVGADADPGVGAVAAAGVPGVPADGEPRRVRSLSFSINSAFQRISWAVRPRIAVRLG